MLQSNFKNKIRAVKYWKRHAKWAQWKSLCKLNPDKYKIVIEGDTTKVVLAFFEKYDSSIPEKVGPSWALKDSLEWSLE